MTETISTRKPKREQLGALIHRMIDLAEQAERIGFTAEHHERATAPGLERDRLENAKLACQGVRSTLAGAAKVLLLLIPKEQASHEPVNEQ